MNAAAKNTESVTPDIAFALLVGFLAAGIRTYFVMLMAFTGRSAAAIGMFGSVQESHMVVWAISRESGVDCYPNDELADRAPIEVSK